MGVTHFEGQPLHEGGDGGQAFGSRSLAQCVRGTVATLADGRVEPPTPDEVASFAERFPAQEFPYLHEVALCEPDFFERDFDFGIRSLARGLLASAEVGCPRS